MEGWVSISRGGPQRLPASSGGVTAFKFRDPECHPLEFLTFPAGAVPPIWQKNPADVVFQGIDHSAISVSDTERSITFYENLGFAVADRSSNRGAAQEALDNLASARVEVTALAARQPKPHLELLCYSEVSPGENVMHSNADIATTRLVLAGSDAILSRGLMDPDGHHLVIEGRALK
jgi:catechol 2,3-dioxygenase-like lactoylglutathione lyase family enzyme